MGGPTNATLVSMLHKIFWPAAAVELWPAMGWVKCPHRPTIMTRVHRHTHSQRYCEHLVQTPVHDAIFKDQLTDP